jgi:DNA polymerase III subunit delta'
MRLADIVGQDHALAVVGRALRAGRLAHAYLFDGPEGVGKRGAAVGLGLALMCPAQPGEGCGRCETCRRVLAGNHPDVWSLDAAALPDLAKAAGDKSAVKYAGRFVFPYALAAPHEGTARVLVVDHADELSPDVQNTLLKTLEEPRPAVHIVLVTAARDRLLPTILSRTQRVRFAPVRPQALVEIAAARGVDQARAETAAALAGGSVTRMLALAAAEGDGDVGPWAEVDSLRAAAGGRGAGDIFDAALRLGDKEAKQQLPAVLALLGGLYRDALVSAVGAPELAQLGQRAAEIQALAARARAGDGLARLRRALIAVIDADTALVSNVNTVTALERLMMEMRATEKAAAGAAGAPPP